MYNVRTSSQAANGNVEMELIQKILAFNGVANQKVVFQLPKAAPLSWKLTEEEQEAIVGEWCAPANQQALVDARTFFSGWGGTASLPASLPKVKCNLRIVRVYIPRGLASTLTAALAQFPSALVTGPRQSGKTTFLLEEFGRGARYLTLDDPLERGFAASDPNGFLDRFPEDRVILDEIQYAPELLPYLKIRIDQDRQRQGRWLLTGSQQFQLMANVSESLAGRIALLELLPFSLLETRGVRSPDLAPSSGTVPIPILRSTPRSETSGSPPTSRPMWSETYGNS